MAGIGEFRPPKSGLEMIGNALNVANQFYGLKSNIAALGAAQKAEEERAKAEAQASDPNSQQSTLYRYAAQKSGFQLPDTASYKDIQPLAAYIQQAQKGQQASDLERQKLEGLMKLSGVKQANSPEHISEAQKSVDRAFGKNYEDFVASGGAAQIAKSLNQLKEIRARFDNPNLTLTGGIAGSLPLAIRTYVNPESADTQQLLEDVIQRQMRPILGAQFTDKEGERLIKRSYDPKLPPEKNKERLDRLINELEQTAAAKINAANYYEQNGTLMGYKGKLPSQIIDLNGTSTASNKASPQQSGSLVPNAQASESGSVSADDLEALKWAKSNPNDPRAGKIIDKLRLKGFK